MWKTKEKPIIKKTATLLFLLSLAQLILGALTKERLESPVAAKPLKVMTYNLFFKNRNPAGSIQLIKKTNPDLLFVQELTPAWKVLLEQALGKRYPYHKTQAMKGTHGIGVYSKYPIKKNDLLLNSARLSFAQVTELTINSKRVRTINIHLASPAVAVENSDQFARLYWQNYRQRTQELEEINSVAQHNQSDFSCQLLVGDFNTLFVEPIYQSLKKDWVNVYHKSGEGLGLNFPNSGRSKPFMTLDYIMASGKAKCLSAKVLKGGHSDHLPVVAELEL